MSTTLLALSLILPAVAGGTELCDGKDNDGDGIVDESPADAPTWYQDADADGYGDPATSTVACDQPAGYAADGGDCDDADPSVNPGATEVADGGGHRRRGRHGRRW